MRFQVFHVHIHAQSRVWVIPAVYILLSLILGALMPFLDEFLFKSLDLFRPETATTLLSTIAGGMISFTGIVFSMVFVMVQFSSNAYSPRLAPFYLQDGVIKHSLGMFTATFLFALTALAAMDLYGKGLAPDLSVITALGAVICSAFFFLALIQRVSVLQVTSVLYMVAHFGRREIIQNYPHICQPDSVPQNHHHPVLPPLSQTVVYSGISAAVLDFDLRQLNQLAQKAQAVIEVVYPTGDTVPEGAVFMKVYGGTDKISDWQLLRTVKFGEQRTIDQDPKYSLRLIVDIAIRALSPAINDPTTAVMALDRLEDLLRLLVTRQLDVGFTYDKDGNLRVIYPTPEWDDFLALAIDEIRYYGAKSVQVSRRLLSLLNDLEGVAPDHRKAIIKEHSHRVELSIRRTFSDKEDRHEAGQLDRQGIGLTRSSDEQ